LYFEALASGETSVMEISFTDNIAKRLLDVLNPSFYESKRVNLAVAFIKYSGFLLIEENLNRCLKNNSQVEFLVGLDFRTTEPKALRKLRLLSDKGFPIKCYCFSDPLISDTPVYHPKLYLLSDERKATIIVGSSNLTAGGLRSNMEVNAVIIADLQEEIVSDIYGLYNKLKFQQQRFEPSSEYIEKYEEAYKRVQKGNFSALQEKTTKQIMKELEEQEKVLPKPVPTGLGLFGWQRIVYERLPLQAFRTSDMYVYEKEFQKYYPENKHIRDKTRQILQQLRDTGLLRNPSRDRWERI
jgi:HKD family nuclease